LSARRTVPDETPRGQRPEPPPSSGDAPRDRLELSLFWRESSLWPVTFCVIAGLAATGAGAVSMAITQRNPFARMALAIAAATTLFGMWDLRSRKGKLGGGALLVGVLWALSIAGGVVLARMGD
jgi:hypothetical protein